MKKTFRIIIIIAAFAFVSVMSLGIIGADAKISVAKQYLWDDNIYYGATNYHNYTYIAVPNDTWFDSYDQVRVGSGWNYVRYQRTNYYKSSEGMH